MELLKRLSLGIILSVIVVTCINVSAFIGGAKADSIGVIALRLLCILAVGIYSGIKSEK